MEMLTALVVDHMSSHEHEARNVMREAGLIVLTEGRTYSRASRKHSMMSTYIHTHIEEWKEEPSYGLDRGGDLHEARKERPDTVFQGTNTV